jgi:hypothetical protein
MCLFPNFEKKNPLTGQQQKQLAPCLSHYKFTQTKALNLSDSKDRKDGFQGSKTRHTHTGRSRDGDEAPGAEGAVEAAPDTEAERDVAEARRALHVGRHHRAAAVGATPGRLVRRHHALRLVANQHQAHLLPPPLLSFLSWLLN